MCACELVAILLSLPIETQTNGKNRCVDNENRVDFHNSISYSIELNKIMYTNMYVLILEHIFSFPFTMPALEF